MIETQKYLGERYKFNGRGGPYDCLGLVLEVLRDNGIDLPGDDGKKITSNWMNENPERLVEGLGCYFNQIDIEDKQPLDVAVFLIGGIPRHAGVIIDNYRIIHIFDNSTVHISRISKWKKRLHSIWRAR